MNSKKTDFTVGIFVLVGLAAIVYMAITLGGGGLLGGGQRPVTAIFTNIGGLSSGSNVAISGVKVGTVGKITLDRETLRAQVELLINEDIELWSDATASIKTSGLIGDKFISVYPGTPDPDFGEELDGPIVDTEPALDLEGLISRFAFGDVTQGGGGNPSGSGKDGSSADPEGSESGDSGENPFPEL